MNVKMCPGNHDLRLHIMSIDELDLKRSRRDVKTSATLEFFFFFFCTSRKNNYAKGLLWGPIIFDDLVKIMIFQGHWVNDVVFPWQIEVEQNCLMFCCKYEEMLPLENTSLWFLSRKKKKQDRYFTLPLLLIVLFP